MDFCFHLNIRRSGDFGLIPLGNSPLELSHGFLFQSPDWHRGNIRKRGEGQGVGYRDLFPHLGLQGPGRIFIAFRAEVLLSLGPQGIMGQQALRRTDSHFIDCNFLSLQVSYIHLMLNLEREPSGGYWGLRPLLRFTLPNGSNHGLLWIFLT